jgi:CBS domain-containing protein
MHRSRVEEWMSVPPLVVSPTTTLAAAQSLMEEHHLHHLPVVHAQRRRVVGIAESDDDCRVYDAQPGDGRHRRIGARRRQANAGA